MKIALGLLCLLAWCLMCSGAIATESMLAGALIALLLRGHVWRHRG